MGSASQPQPVRPSRSSVRRKALAKAHRILRCVFCRQLTTICTPCDRGHSYCSPACRTQGRIRQVREAGRSYQQRGPGRAKHAARQRAYAARQRAASPQGEPAVQSGRLQAAQRSPHVTRPPEAVIPSLAARAPRGPVCCLCGNSSAGWARARWRPRSRRGAQRLGRRLLGRSP